MIEVTTSGSPTRLAEIRRGWRSLVGATFGLAFGIVSIPLYTNSVLFARFDELYGWSASSLSLVFLVCNLLLAVFAPLCGRIVDRFGHRVPAFVSALVLAGGYLVLTIDPSNFALYAGSQFAVYVGAGCSAAIAHARTVSGSFSRMRGLALGIMNTGPALVALFIPALLGLFLESGGLVAGYLFLAGIVAVAAVISFLVTPDRLANISSSPAPREKGAFLAALKDRTLLTLVAVCFVMGVATIGLIEHLFSLLLTAGVAESAVLWMFGVLGTAMLIIRLAVGALLDAFSPKPVAAVVMGLAAVGVASLAVFGPAAAGVATFSLGLALGAETDIMGVLVSRYFPLERFGQIFGFVSLAFALGVAVGPLALSLVMESTDSAGPTVLVAAALFAVVAAGFMTLPRLTRGAPDVEREDRADVAGVLNDAQSN